MSGVGGEVRAAMARLGRPAVIERGVDVPGLPNVVELQDLAVQNSERLLDHPDMACRLDNRRRCVRRWLEAGLKNCVATAGW